MRLGLLAGTFGTIVLLTGCYKPSTGILPAGPETYTITEKLTVLLGGTEAAEHAALTKANEYCAQQGRQFLPLMMAGQSGSPSQFPGYTVTFKCLLPGDPAIAKFQLQQTPNVIIEQRIR
jgi:hypothetical protein